MLGAQDDAQKEYPMILRLTLDLPEDTAYVSMTRHLSRSTLEFLQVTERTTDDVQFIIGELCDNVILHAESQEGRFQVVLEYFADRVVVTVEDKGGGFSFADVPPPGTMRRDKNGQERVGGFGLPIVQKLSDRIDFRRADPQGMMVQAEKQLDYQSAAAEEEAEEMTTGESGDVTVTMK